MKEETSTPGGGRGSWKHSDDRLDELRKKRYAREKGGPIDNPLGDPLGVTI